jgi:hypothetical protein
MTTNYQRALMQKERELELVLAIDHVRDSYDDDEDPQGMFDALVDLVRDQFKADACAIALLEETSDNIETTAQVGFDDRPQDVEFLCREAMSTPGITPITTGKWDFVIGLQVVLKRHPLAGMVLARNETPFSREEVALLEMAEKQIDSAVIQARTVWKLVQRNRELEAIYQLDRLRDEHVKEMDLIAGFTTILLDKFRADLCMLMLSEAHSGELIIRGVVDERRLPVDVLDALRDAAAKINIPQIIPTPTGIPNLNLLAAPFIVDGSRLGAVIVGRGDEFSVGDHRLLFAMTSQMDSAIAHSRAVNKSN